jgi:hypothetical protein
LVSARAKKWHGSDLFTDLGCDIPKIKDILGSCYFHLYLENKNGIIKVYIAIFFAIWDIIVYMKLMINENRT